MGAALLATAQLVDAATASTAPASTVLASTASTSTASVSTASASAAAATAPAAPTPPAPSAGLPTLGASTSLLVVSPHPDDETLCCAGVIRRVLEAGGHVSVVWITSGDGSALSMLFTEKSVLNPVEKVHDLAGKRMLEARTATGILGVNPTQQYFLGYPDGGIQELLTTHRSSPLPAKFTGETRVPYSDALFPGHPYTGESLEKDFEAVLERVQPNLILAPSPMDTHPDHAGSGALARGVLSRRGELGKARYWIVHGGEGWPSPRGYMPDIPLNTPPRGAELNAQEFTLTDAEEDSKHQAIEAYHTQTQFMAPFLLAFVRTSERYSALSVPEGH
jgi:LmbE family N-acetylglucosaminyl deacetylase